VNSAPPVTTTATITEVNDAPVADANGPYFGVEGELVYFNGSGSYDPDDDTLTYSWDFGDDTTPGTGEAPSHTYAGAQTYTVTLIVNDGASDSGPSTTTADIAPSDTVEITKAEYNTGKRELKVEATSTASPNSNVFLTLKDYEDYGPMDYNARKDKYSITLKDVANPINVTVTSSFHGEDDSPVTTKGGKGKNK
jgi:PKD repeat protein